MAKFKKPQRGKCPVGTKVQTIVFPKEKFTTSEARKWLVKNKYKHLQYDEKENTYRFRQIDPKKVTDMRTIHFGNETGIKAVIGCPVKSKTTKKKK